LLLELEIENFALVERLEVPFGGGLNVLTGETGAGKSILLDAIDYLLGGPHPNMRPDATHVSRVSGHFETTQRSLAWLLEQGYGACEELLLSRECSVQGRSSARINGRLATSAQIRELGDNLVEIHGQHQSTQLLRPSMHLKFLDSFCGAAQSKRLEEYRAVYGRLRDLDKQLASLNEQSRSRAREEEWIHHELGEINAAQLQVGEEEATDVRLRKLQGQAELQKKLRQVLHSLSGDKGAQDQVSTARRVMSGLVRFDDDLKAHERELDQAEIIISESIHGLQNYLAGCESSPRELEDLMERKNQLRELKRKYGPDVDAILAYAAEIEGKLAKLQSITEDTQVLVREKDELTSRRDQLAAELSKEREDQAQRLEAAVDGELHQLHLANAEFKVGMTACEPGPQGAQDVEFLFSANPGSPPRPLTKVASGGELSRMLLALLVLLDRQNPIPILIFDEVDSGLGGRAAEAVAAKLSQVASGRQVLCVTHLPVIAAAGDPHLRVLKTSHGNSTHLQLAALDPASREEEIARMLSGDATPKAARSHARELLRRKGVTPAKPLK
jgi:DNA repair protein RecN (Recombination protein N)